MENTQKEFKKITKFCKLLQYEHIKQELNSYLYQCNLVNIEKSPGGGIRCDFNNNESNIKLLLNSNSFTLIKSSDNLLERIVINDIHQIYQRNIEKRDNGIVVSDIEKHFDVSSRFNDQYVLVDLRENRHILTNKKLCNLLDEPNVLSNELKKIAVKIRKFDLYEFSDLTTKFSTHMNYYYFIPFERRAIKDNIYPTKTYLNEEEISYIYGLVDGPDKLYRIYDLYNGIINKRNEYDITSIQLGLLAKDGFDLKTLEGITQQENDLIGESLIPVSDEYKNYLKEFFNNFNGYTEEIKLDRESILTAIDYVMPIRKYAKKHIEENVGIPYDEYERMEFDEQLKVNSLSYKLKRKTKNFFKNFKK